jgi:hypothetical protein
MTHKLWVRNPETGLLDVKEFASESQLGLLRIADPVATQVVQGYTNATLVGDRIMTPLKMAKETGRFPAFGKEAMVIPGNIKRDVGERVQRLQTQSGYVTMSLSEYALGVGIENRERNEWAGAPDMLLNVKLQQVTDRIALYREYLQSKLITTTTSYASGLYISGAAKKWGGSTPTGDAVKDMLDMILLVQSYVGTRPNVVWFSPAGWSLWRRNPAVLDLMKYQGTPANPAQVSYAATAALLEVQECVVGYAVYGTGGKGSGGGVGKGSLTMAYLWDAVQSANAGCCVRGTAAGIEPALGYTYERMNSPVIESYYDNATKSQIWDYEHFFDPAITLNTAGGMYYSLA